MDRSGPKFADREGSRADPPPPAGPTVYVMPVDRVRELDRLAVEEFGIPSIVLMENAARSIVPKAVGMLGGPPNPDKPKTVLIVCGSGNNGGDGLAIARHLANAGARVSIGLLAEPEAFRGDAAINLRIARNMDIPIEHEAGTETDTPHLVIDAMFGTGLSRALEGRARSLVKRIAEHRTNGAGVLAVDVPSGLDADTGEPIGGVCVSADATVTLAAVKPGLTSLDAQPHVGELSVGDIGVPRSLLERLGTPWTPHGTAGRTG